MSFHHGGLEGKSGKSRDTRSNRQVWPWTTERSRAKANSFAKRTHQSEQAPASKNKTDNSTHGPHQMVNTKIRLIIFFPAEDGEALYSQQRQDGKLTLAQVVLTAKVRLKLEKVGKSTRLFRWDLKQTPYDYTVEVTNRVRGFDLIGCFKNYGWRFMTLYRRQWSRPSPRKRNAKNTKWLSEEALQIAEKRREAKGRGEKERYTQLNAEF